MGTKWLALTFASLCVVAIGSVRNSGAQNSDTPVTSSIADSLNGVDLKIQSDDKGSYKNSKSLVSIIQASLKDWELDTNVKGSSRTVFVSLTDPIPGSGPNGGAPIAPFAEALVNGRFISKCSLARVNILNIPVGSRMQCPMTLGFDYGGQRYRMQMNPGPNGTDVDPETDSVDWVCNASNGTSCNSWTVEPNGLKGGYAGPDVKQNVVRLSKMVTSRGQTVPVNHGNFRISFSISVTNP